MFRLANLSTPSGVLLKWLWIVAVLLCASCHSDVTAPLVALPSFCVSDAMVREHKRREVIPVATRVLQVDGDAPVIQGGWQASPVGPPWWPDFLLVRDDKIMQWNGPFGQILRFTIEDLSGASIGLTSRIDVDIEAASDWNGATFVNMEVLLYVGSDLIATSAPIVFPDDGPGGQWLNRGWLVTFLGLSLTVPQVNDINFALNGLTDGNGIIGVDIFEPTFTYAAISNVEKTIAPVITLGEKTIGASASSEKTIENAILPVVGWEEIRSNIDSVPIQWNGTLGAHYLDIRERGFTQIISFVSGNIDRFFFLVNGSASHMSKIRFTIWRQYNLIFNATANYQLNYYRNSILIDTITFPNVTATEPRYFEDVIEWPVALDLLPTDWHEFQLRMNFIGVIASLKVDEVKIEQELSIPTPVPFTEKTISASGSSEKTIDSSTSKEKVI